MKKSTDSATEADIRRNTVLNLWRRGTPPKRISEKMEMPVEDIYSLLKEAQKALVAKAQG